MGVLTVLMIFIVLLTLVIGLGFIYRSERKLFYFSLFLGIVFLIWAVYILPDYYVYGDKSKFPFRLLLLLSLVSFTVSLCTRIKEEVDA